MKHPRLSLEEFDTLFPNEFASQEERLQAYETLLQTLKPVGDMPVPELTARERADIFRRSWPGEAQRRLCPWPVFWRRPAVTFAFGLVLGCTVMFGVMQAWSRSVQANPLDRALHVERAGQTQTYTGTVLQALYPQIENPKMVLEQKTDPSVQHRVVHGTLDNGNIQILWNL